MQITRNDVKVAVRGGNASGRARMANPFANPEFVSIMPEGYRGGNYVLVKIHSDEFGDKLILWDGENANAFRGIETVEYRRGVRDSRMFARSIWTITTMGTFDSESAFDKWMEAN